MAPKAPPPAEPAAADAPTDDPMETHMIISALVDDLLTTTTSIKPEDVPADLLHPHPLALALQEKELSEKAKSYTVNMLEKSMRAQLEMFYIDFDIGEPEGAGDWSVGEEPTPCPIDSWSRGALKIIPPKPLPPPPRTPSEAPPKSPRRPSSRPTSQGGAPSSEPLGGPPAKEPIFVAKPPEGYVAPVVKKVAPIVTAAERKAKQLAAQAREEVERLERLKADLKGREYTYDARGNIIVMEPMNADRLPAFQQQPRLGLAAEKAPNARKKALAKGGGGKAMGRIDFGGSATFKQLDSLQPPVTETMNVERGVLLRQGDATKDGGPREFEGERITRSTFEELANSTGGFLSRKPVAADAAAAASNPVEPVPPSPSKAAANPGMAPDVAASPALRPPSMPPSPENVTGLRNPVTRERGGMPTKTKLPPPNLGATTGHGQSLPYAEKRS